MKINKTFDPRPGEQGLIVEAGIGVAIGAALLAAVYSAWKFLFGEKEPAFYPRPCDMSSAGTLTSDVYKRAVVAQIIRSLGYTPQNMDMSKVPVRPIETEGEMRALIEVLGLKAPQEFGSNWQALCKEEEARKKAAAAAQPVIVQMPAPAQDPGLIAGVARSIEALAGRVEAISAQVFPVPTAPAPTAPAPAAQPPATPPAPRIPLTDEQKVEVLDKVLDVVDKLPAPAPAK